MAGADTKPKNDNKPKDPESEARRLLEKGLRNHFRLRSGECHQPPPSRHDQDIKRKS